jgi:hypothetical protein
VHGVVIVQIYVNTALRRSKRTSTRGVHDHVKSMHCVCVQALR